MIKQIKMSSYQAAVQQGVISRRLDVCLHAPNCPLPTEHTILSVPKDLRRQWGARGLARRMISFADPSKHPLTTLPSATLAESQLVKCGQNSVESINSLIQSQRLHTHSYLFETFRFARFAQCTNQSRFLFKFPGFVLFDFYSYNSG